MSKIKFQSIFRWLATLFFVVAGLLHFIIPEFYLAMMPPFIPFQQFFIIVSGIAETAGAIGIQIPRFRKLAGIGLIVLLVAVFPANIYVAIVNPVIPNLEYSASGMWWRLLLQPIFIAWIWWVSVKRNDQLIMDNENNK
jgi:uncharacterized membrane protein